MKKVILILLCLALTLNFASAVAETAEKTAIGTISMNGAFELRGVLPEGYQLRSRGTISLPSPRTTASRRWPFPLHTMN